MHKTLGRLLTLLLFLGLGIFLVWLITHNLTPQQWERIRTVFRQADYAVLIPVFLVGALSHFLRALRWRLFFRPLGYTPGIFSTFCAVMIGYLANLALPRMGEITRCGVLSRNDRIPFDKVLGTMIAERVIDLICLAVLLAATVLVQLHIVSDFFYELVIVRFGRLVERAGSLSGMPILAGVIVLGVFLWLILKRFRTASWLRRLTRLLTGIKKGALSILQMDKKGVFILYTFGIWTCYFLMVYIGFFALAPTSGLGLKPGLSVLSFGSIGMVVTQGGIGAYQLIVEKVLGLYGIAEAYGFAFGWLSWLAQTLLTLVLGFGAMVAIPFIRRKKPSSMAA